MSPEVEARQKEKVMDRVLRFPEVKQITGLSLTTIWEQEKTGKFPNHLQPTARSVGWREYDVHEWMKGPVET